MTKTYDLEPAQKLAWSRLLPFQKEAMLEMLAAREMPFDEALSIAELRFPKFTSSDRRSHPEGLMNPDKVVVHEVNCNGSRVILNLLAKGIRQARKPANLHSHGEVLTFYVAGRNMRGIRIANDLFFLATKALSGALTLYSNKIRWWRCSNDQNLRPGTSAEACVESIAAVPERSHAGNACRSRDAIR